MTDRPRPVLLFDGVCHLCNAAVRWVIAHDRLGRFTFASLQSEAARRLLGTTAQALPDSVVLIDEAGVHVESDAALRIAVHLGRPWSWLWSARILPRSCRDGAYRWIARNRYRWFGRRDVCLGPTPALRDRFLDADEFTAARAAEGP